MNRSSSGGAGGGGRLARKKSKGGSQCKPVRGAARPRKPMLVVDVDTHKDAEQSGSPRPVESVGSISSTSPLPTPSPAALSRTPFSPDGKSWRKAGRPTLRNRTEPQLLSLRYGASEGAAESALKASKGDMARAGRMLFMLLGSAFRSPLASKSKTGVNGTEDGSDDAGSSQL